MGHPKALPGSRPEPLEDLKEKPNSLFHGRTLQAAKSSEPICVVKALRWGWVLGKTKPL